MYEEIVLIAEREEPDENGDLTAVETRRTIFAERKSVGQTEFYQAMAQGLKPELKFVVYRWEYGGEKKVEAGGSVYRVVRTYAPPGDYLELVCEGGVNRGGAVAG